MSSPTEPTSPSEKENEQEKNAQQPIEKGKRGAKVKGTSILTTAASFVLRRIKGTQTWQRFQVRRNTVDNVDITKDPEIMKLEYCKPSVKLNAHRPGGAARSSGDVASSNGVAESCCRRVGFVGMVRELLLPPQEPEEEERIAAEKLLQSKSKVLDILGLPGSEAKAADGEVAGAPAANGEAASRRPMEREVPLANGADWDAGDSPASSHRSSRSGSEPSQSPAQALHHHHHHHHGAADAAAPHAAAADGDEGHSAGSHNGVARGGGGEGGDGARARFPAEVHPARLGAAAHDFDSHSESEGELSECSPDAAVRSPCPPRAEDARRGGEGLRFLSEGGEGEGDAAARRAAGELSAVGGWLSSLLHLPHHDAAPSGGVGGSRSNSRESSPGVGRAAARSAVAAHGDAAAAASPPHRGGA